ncbi:MAG TPA: hypothetical protein VFD54_04820 [Anaerolineales bacterium]|nr:hypothetical protein [Anaerolineales bacterium]
MKPRIQFLITISVLIVILVITWISYSNRGPEPMQIFPATIHKACAPWDGPAFTLFISLNDGNFMQVFIWQAADIPVPVTFGFPDQTGQVGFAYIGPIHEPLQQEQSGEVSFQRVEKDVPVEGEFDFRTENGKRFIGKFKAEWDNAIVMCG